MNLYRIVDESEIEVELVALKCTNCNTALKIEKKVVDLDEAFVCPYCRKNGWTFRA